jgi:ascorbate-specific PTS system EIIC-type component UlaA
VISLFFSVASIGGVSDCLGGWGVAVFCVKFATFLVCVVLC